jgi:crotonobetainyl-CoA:carnitine CoA-transferase CaiB-like acyl-CoA transferase
VSSPIGLAGQAPPPPSLAPALGEHTVEVRRENGFSAAEIERLLALGVVRQGSRPPPGPDYS